MKPESLNCPMCGAAVSTDATQCLYCTARLATIACPTCFGMMFTGSRHCPRCGAEAARTEAAADETVKRLCPRCRIEMESVVVGAANLRECVRCGGLWVDAASFQKICADREQQSAVLGAASPLTERAQAVAAGGRVQYVPCPVCGQLMNRANFARCSGVVVDVCKGHGTWFDRDELQQIVEFIQRGGLDAARAREKQQLSDEWQRLRQEQLELDRNRSAASSPLQMNTDRQSIVAAAGELLKLLGE
jgi:Zn-finger nucleic acid-binding protein